MPRRGFVPKREVLPDPVYGNTIVTKLINQIMLDGPIEIRPERRQTLALRWLVEFSRKRGEKTMAERLCAEIIDASNNTGAAVKRKEEMHRMAEANKAFAHFRF